MANTRRLKRLKLIVKDDEKSDKWETVDEC